MKISICSFMARFPCLTSLQTTMILITMMTSKCSIKWARKCARTLAKEKMRTCIQTMVKKRPEICTWSGKEFKRSMRKSKILSVWWWAAARTMTRSKMRTSLRCGLIRRTRWPRPLPILILHLGFTKRGCRIDWSESSSSLTPWTKIWHKSNNN